MRRPAHDQKIEAMRGISGLEDCPRAELVALGRVCDEHAVARGERLSTEGRPGREAWIILQGTADVRRRDTLLWEAGPGDLVGDIGVLGFVPAAVTLVATAPMKVLALAPLAADTVFSEPTLARWAFAKLNAQLRVLLGVGDAYETAPASLQDDGGELGVGGEHVVALG
jgi:CRP-like cAMP-binding protein